MGDLQKKKKGFDYISRISKYLIGKIDFQWIIIGRDTNKLMQKEFFKKYSKYFRIIDEISSNSEYMFPNTQLIKFYKSSHVYANLARIESFGITLIEAMASYMPVLSFYTKGGEELVKDKKNGFLIKNGNFKDYSRKLISISKNNILKKNIKSFNDIYLSRFDLKNTCLETINYYKKIDKN